MPVADRRGPYRPYARHRPVKVIPAEKHIHRGEQVPITNAKDPRAQEIADEALVRPCREGHEVDSTRPPGNVGRGEFLEGR